MRFLPVVTFVLAVAFAVARATKLLREQAAEARDGIREERADTVVGKDVEQVIDDGIEPSPAAEVVVQRGPFKSACRRLRA